MLRAEPYHGARLDCRRYSFSQRVVNNWNALPAEAVSCTTVNSFKGKIAPLIQHIRCRGGLQGSKFVVFW